MWILLKKFKGSHTQSRHTIAQQLQAPCSTPQHWAKVDGVQTAPLHHGVVPSLHVNQDTSVIVVRRFEGAALYPTSLSECRVLASSINIIKKHTRPNTANYVSIQGAGVVRVHGIIHEAALATAGKVGQLCWHLNIAIPIRHHAMMTEELAIPAHT